MVVDWKWRAEVIAVEWVPCANQANSLEGGLLDLGTYILKLTSISIFWNMILDITPCAESGFIEMAWSQSLIAATGFFSFSRALKGVDDCNAQELTPY